MAKGGWSGKPTDFALEVEDGTMVLFRELCEQASRAVIYNIARDTTRLRANTNFSVNVPDESYDPNKRDVTGSTTLADARRAMAALKPGDSFHIVNRTPYGKYVEAGHPNPNTAGTYAGAFNTIKELGSS